MNSSEAVKPDIDREAALRIGLATRVLPGVGVARVLAVLQRRIPGRIDAESLKGITVTDIKTGLTGDADEDEADDHGIALSAIKEAVRMLWGEADNSRLPALQEAFADRAGVIQVAVASGDGEFIDGHFGSCARFLVYQLRKDGIRLVDIRSTIEAELAEDRNAVRAALIKDCKVMFVQSIGGPAAAKVIRAGIYPIKVKDGISARDELEKLRAVMESNPPPWLAKVMGLDAEQRIRFDRSEELA